MIKVAESASKKLKGIITEQGYTDKHFVRVSVEGGGCSGLQYKLDFDDQMKEGDQEFEDNDIKVVVDVKSFLYLAGTTLEYSDGLNGKGFAFNNPNASRTCGCGESFAV